MRIFGEKSVIREVVFETLLALVLIALVHGEIAAITFNVTSVILTVIVVAVWFFVLLPRALAVEPRDGDLSMWSSALGPNTIERLTELFYGSSKLYKVLFLLNLVFLGPLAEELLFRGFLMKMLSGYVGALAALLIQGALFGMIHLQYRVEVRKMVALMGVGFGVLALISNSLLPSLVQHSLLNLNYVIASKKIISSIKEQQEKEQVAKDAEETEEVIEIFVVRTISLCGSNYQTTMCNGHNITFRVS